MFLKKDPGPCPVDDAPHTTCTSPDYQGMAIVQLPNRDGFSEPRLVGAVRPPLLVGQMIQQQLESPTAVTTATYGQSTPRTMKRVPAAPKKR